MNDGPRWVLTELFLAAAAVQVDPHFAVAVVAHARVLLIVESVEGTTHHGVDLRRAISIQQDKFPCLGCVPN